MKYSKLFLFVLISVLITNCTVSKKDKMTKELNVFIQQYELVVKPLIKQACLAYYDAAISGKDEDYKKAAEIDIKLTKVYSNKEDFKRLKVIYDSKAVEDPILKRQLDMLYNAYLSKQIDDKKLEAIINLGNAIEQKFSTFRAEVNNKKISDNDVEELLGKSTNNEDLKNTWLASKKIGNVVSEDVKKIVKLRNEVAKELGFNNYHEMSLSLDDQKPEEIEAIFDELDNLTAKTYAGLKGEIDTYLAQRYKIKKEELMPWHYQNRFFQEAPQIYKVDLDSYYKTKDLVTLTKDYYASIDLDMSDLLKNSDLYEKPGKNQHAFCTDIDHEGDVRVLCNVKSNSKWMNTMLHEYGHAVYQKYVDRKLPFTLRDPAHTFTTEAIAMMFGRFASNPQWLKDMVGISDAEKTKIADDCFKTLRLEQLVFSRWAQVMYRFEKGMYANPDQDLNALWWSLVEKYQLVKKPEGRNEPDWATKIHIATSPCYYHNYLLGELLASQLYYYIVKNVVKSDDFKYQSFVNNKEVGKFLKEKVFAPGRKWYWNDMIFNATGEKLTAKYYAMQFVN